MIHSQFINSIVRDLQSRPTRRASLQRFDLLRILAAKSTFRRDNYCCTGTQSSNINKTSWVVHDMCGVCMQRYILDHGAHQSGKMF